MDQDIIIHPMKTKKDSRLPRHGILFVNPGEAKAALEQVTDNGGRRAFLHHAKLGLTAAEDRFVAGPAIGAPSGVLILEKLIVLGATDIVLMGWCGAVDEEYRIGDIVVPTGAVCGEGTSPYYSDNRYPQPSSQGVDMLRELLDKEDLPSKGGKIWSTDAPYRESRKQLQLLHTSEQVVGVDMEFSALCTVAGFRGVNFSAVLIVSDELWSRRWKPGFKDSRFQEHSKRIMHILLNRQVEK